MKTRVWVLRGIAGGSTLIGGFLLIVVHDDVSGMSANAIPIGVRILIYPLAVLTYLVGAGACLSFCFRRVKRHSCLWMFVGTLLNLMAMALLFIAWLLVIRLYVLPFGRSV